MPDSHLKRLAPAADTRHMTITLKRWHVAAACVVGFALLLVIIGGLLPESDSTTSSPSRPAAPPQPAQETSVAFNVQLHREIQAEIVASIKARLTRRGLDWRGVKCLERGDSYEWDCFSKIAYWDGTSTYMRFEARYNTRTNKFAWWTV